MSILEFFNGIFTVVPSFFHSALYFKSSVVQIIGPFEQDHKFAYRQVIIMYVQGAHWTMRF